MSARWTEAEYEEFRRRKKRTLPTNGRSERAEAATLKATSGPLKYKNKKTEVDGIAFDSKKEAARYQDLITLQRDGKIRDLTRQVRMPLEIDGEKVCVYVCDFRYEERVNGGWRKVYEDAKGLRTPVYLLKKKLVKAILGVDILET